MQKLFILDNSAILSLKFIQFYGTKYGCLGYRGLGSIQLCKQRHPKRKKYKKSQLLKFLVLSSRMNYTRSSGIVYRCARMHVCGLTARGNPQGSRLHHKVGYDLRRRGLMKVCIAADGLY